MDARLEHLKQKGCDIDGAMHRLLDDEELLLECIGQVLCDPAYEQLGKALEQGDAAAAFDAAHLLKGIAGNTGLTPLYQAVVRLVEPLRAGSTENLTGFYEELVSAVKTLQAALDEAPRS